MDDPQLSPRRNRRLGDGWVRFVPWVLVVALIVAFYTARSQGWAALASPVVLVEVVGSGLIGGGILGALFGRKRQ